MSGWLVPLMEFLRINIQIQMFKHTLATFGKVYSLVFLGVMVEKLTGLKKIGSPPQTMSRILESLWMQLRLHQAPTILIAMSRFL